MTFKDTKKPLIATVVVWKDKFSMPRRSDCPGRRALRRALRSWLPLPTRASTRLLSPWVNAVAALHSTCTQTCREYFPMGCKKLEFAEWATDKENWLEVRCVYIRHPWGGVILLDVYTRQPRFNGSFTSSMRLSRRARTPILAAIFSSYGNGTRQDRFIPVSTALLKKKQLDGMHACMCMQARCLRRSSVSNRSPTALLSFQLCRGCFLRGLAFSQ